LNSHSEAVWVTLKKEVSREEVVNTLGNFEGIAVLDKDFPTAIEVSGEDPVFVGRIHQDRHNKKRWLMWVVSDNLKKGAALNGLQIAEKLYC
jgi:aspartate-semialdehyde dehydrogenase